MNESIWNNPLEALVDDLAAPKPAPAGVTAAAVSARLGLALLIKTLAIAGQRKNFSGDVNKLREMIETAHLESAKLAVAADDDIVADAARRRIEVPMQAARAAEAALTLCAEAKPIVTGALAADLEVATSLLEAALRAIQGCLRSNTQARP